MRIVGLVLGLLFGTWVALSVPVRGDSLFDPALGDIFAPRLILVGDLVTIRIADQSRTSQQVDVQSGSEAGITGPLATLATTITGIDLGNRDQASRSETAKAVTQYTDTVTARVVGVDGDRLILKASRLVNLDGKRKEIALEGVCRRADVAPNNVIFSDLLAEAVIKVDGVYNSPVQPGLLTRVFRILF